MTHVQEIQLDDLHAKNPRNLGVFKVFAGRLRRPMRMENGDLIISAEVTYYCRRQIFRDDVTLRMITTGYDAGDIHITEGAIIRGTEFDVTLKSDYSRYILSANGDELIIENRSDKMGGDYRVELRELREISN